ncbi:MAG: iron-containing alcohol dehydrogenase [Anaerolineae bacterium]|nr:iron-containing alcohol dehydrogenase [Anaerolineae bacterium]NUQ03270.1 iron-containing alcohol dehydrogenase [Anaerolineae bacterium]
MNTIWSLPKIDIQNLTSVQEARPAALLAGRRSWAAVSPLLDLPLVVQAEPERVAPDYLDGLAAALPPQVKVVYGVGGGMVADCAKYIAYRRGISAVIIPTALSVDGFFTPIVAARMDDSVHYVETGPAERIIIDWDVIRAAPPHFRGAAIVELLTIVTGILDWKYAAENKKNTPDTRFIPWAAGLMAGIAQQAFKIAKGVGQGDVEALRNLLDLVCMEVQLTNQMGHTRPQEGSEQYFAYAVEPRAGKGRPVAYADMVGPGILIAAALHNQDITPIRETLVSAGIRINQLRLQDISDTLKTLPQYVRKHDLPFSILNSFEPTAERIDEVIRKAGLDSGGASA